jgi:hypothetical protein
MLPLHEEIGHDGLEGLSFVRKGPALPSILPDDLVSSSDVLWILRYVLGNRQVWCVAARRYRLAVHRNVSIRQSLGHRVDKVE